MCFVFSWSLLASSASDRSSFPLLSHQTGLAYPGLAADYVTPPFDLMWNQGLIKQNLFAVYLDSTPGGSGSAINFGEIDSRYYSGAFTEVPVMSQSYWQLGLYSVAVNGKDASGCTGAFGFLCSSIIDTGTSLIVGPASEVNALLAMIGNVAEDCSNLHQLPNIDIKYSAKGPAFTLKPSTYVIGINDGQCQLGIQGDRTSKLFFQRRLTFLLFFKISVRLTFSFSPFLPLALAGVPFWIMGDTFIRSQYTVFNRAKNTVSFAPIRLQ